MGDYNGPERRTSRPFTQSELDMRYVMRLGDEHRKLIRDVEQMEQKLNDVKGDLKEVRKLNARMERTLVGGWSEDGDEYVTGMRAQTWWIKPLAIGIWAVLIALIPVVLNSTIHLINNGVHP